MQILNLPVDIMSPLGNFHNSRWRPRWLPFRERLRKMALEIILIKHMNYFDIFYVSLKLFQHLGKYISVLHPIWPPFNSKWRPRWPPFRERFYKMAMEIILIKHMKYFDTFYVSFKLFKHFRINIFQCGIQYGRHFP